MRWQGEWEDSLFEEFEQRIEEAIGDAERVSIRLGRGHLVTRAYGAAVETIDSFSDILGEPGQTEQERRAQAEPLLETESRGLASSRIWPRRWPASPAYRLTTCRRFARRSNRANRHGRRHSQCRSNLENVGQAHASLAALD